MALPSNDINDLNRKRIIESSDVPGQPGIVVLNPDGTAVGAPVGGATSANQTNGTQKTQIVDAGGDAVTVTGGKLDVNATASLAGTALPISGATEGVGVAILDGSGNQVTSFGGGTQYTEGDIDTTLTGTITMAEGPSNTVTPLQVDASKHLQVDIAATSADITVQDGGGSLTVDNNGTFAVQASLNAGTNNIGDVDVVSSALPTGASTLAEQQSQTTHLSTIAGDTTSIQTAVELLDDTVATDGSATPTKGILMAGQDGTNAQTIKTDTNGELQVDVLTMPTTTVQATDLDIRNLTNTDVVTAELSAVDNAVLDAIEVDTSTIAGAVSGTEMQVDVLTMPTVTVTATNLDVQSGGADLATTTQAAAIQTSVQLIDDTVQVLGTDTYTEATSKGITLGAVRRDADTTLVNTTNEFTPLQVDANGRLKVEAFSGETLPVSLTSTTVTGTVAVTQSGTWDEVGINDSGNSITVDYATTGSGTATGALRVELPTNGTGVIATVGAVTAITNALPAGTNAIGKLSANSGVDIGDVTLTAGTAAVGSILPPDTDVTAHTNYARKYYTNSGAVTDGIIWSPAAGKRWHVVTMYIQTSAAATITLEDDKAGGDDPVWKGEIAANSGVTLSFTEHYPMASGEDAADLIITTSAGNVYVTCVGYEI